MNRLLGLLLTVFLITACASRGMLCEISPKLNCVNLIDREGLNETIRSADRLQKYEQVDFTKPQPYQKVTRVFKRDFQGNVFSTTHVYHPNGQPKQYIEAINSQALGTYREWHPNGTLKVEAAIVGGSPDLNISAEKTWQFDGLSKAWDENGVLLAEIQYAKGVLSGLTTHYHPNGKVWKSVPYSNNAIDGTLIIFLDNGEILQKGEFKAGLRNGLSFRYWNNGAISSEEDYRQGRLVKASYFDFNDNLISQIENGNGQRAIFGKDSLSELHEYKDGLQEGFVKIFSRNGQLVRIHHIKNHLKHGEEIHYFPQRDSGSSLLPKMQLTWFQGKLQGHCKTWYENGVMENQREMSENEKNGLCTAWYRNGQLMMIEEYETGKLKRGDYYRQGEKTPVSEVLDGKGIVSLFDHEGNFIRKVNYFNGKPEK